MIDVNRSLCEMLNSKPDELLGCHLQQIGDGVQEYSFNDTLLAQMRSTGEWWGELRPLSSSRSLAQVIWIGFSVVRNVKGEIFNYVGMFSDITKLKEVEDQLQQLAYYDPLTGLPNRRLFKERVEARIKASVRDSQKLALLYLDLDRFKFVDDSFGHLAGDQLLVRVSERIRYEIRSRDLVSRQAGDEFTIALFDIEQVLRSLQACGVQSAIDDFGTGYSSLSYLKQLPADTLKIDRSFVRDLSTDPNDRDIAKAIVDLDHSLSMKITAEGVETEAQPEILGEMGCDQVQGWLFAKAAPAAQTAEFLATATPREQPRRVRADLKLV